MSAGNPPRALTGRETQKQQFRTMLGRLAREMNEPSMIVFGLRGVGKTVLLLEFESIADASGWTAPDPIEIRSDTDFRAELADAAYQALLRLDRRRALGDRLKTFTRLLSGFKVGASIEGSVEFSFDPSAVGGSTGNLERDLTHLFVELGETAREHETGVVFLIDEMQFLKREEMEAVAAAMHRMSQKQLPIALAGAGLPQLPGLMVDAKSYAERLFSYPEIGPLSLTPHARRCSSRPKRRASALMMTRFERIVERPGGYAAFVQAYGKETWNMAPGTSSPSPTCRPPNRSSRPSSTRSSSMSASRRPRPPSDATWPRWRTSATAPTTGDVAGRLGGRASSSSVHRDSLIKKGLIFSPDHGEVNFTVPHFSPFMRRRYPL